MTLGRRRCLGLLAAAAVPALAGCGANRDGVTADARPERGRAGGRWPAWLLTRPALAMVTTDATVRAGLAARRVYELLQPGQPPQAMAGARPAVVFGSAAQLVGAVAAGQLPASTTAVLYDPEAWSFTPLAEQRDPVAATERAAAAAHAHGLKLIVAPALNLVTVLAPAGTEVPRWRRFLDLGLVARLAERADAVELQAQSLERDVDQYAAFVRAATRQARAARGDVGVLAGLSANPPGAPVTSDQLIAAWQAAAPSVDGFWLNVPGAGPRCRTCNPARPDVGIELLLAAVRDSSSAGRPASQREAGGRPA